MRVHEKPFLRRGFSLLEILAVMTILAIIAMLVIPRLSSSSNTARGTAHQQNLAEINTAVGRWWLEKGDWPASDLSDIGSDVTYFPEGIPKNPLTGATYTLDTTTHRAQ